MNYPIFVLDWDYDNYDVNEDGSIITLYDASPDMEYVIIMGWLWVGHYISQTLYKRKSIDVYEFIRC